MTADAPATEPSPRSSEAAPTGAARPAWSDRRIGVALVLVGGVLVVVGSLLAAPGAGPSTSVALAKVGIAVVGGLLVGAGAAQCIGGARQRRRERQLAARERSLGDDRAALVQLVSHELRTPLTVIRGGVEILNRSEAGTLDPAHHRLLDATWRATLRLESMVHVVLAAAEASGSEVPPGTTDGDLQQLMRRRLDADAVTADDASLVEIAVPALIEQVAGSLRADLEERLEVDLPADCRIVTVEPYLWVALRCLLDNAAKFSPPDSPIEVACHRDGGHLELSLTDHGPGLPSGYERLAFEPFTQADASLRRSHAGIGMGLYTARRLARQLGGDVLVGTASHGGTIATIRLPDTDRSSDPDGASRVIDLAGRGQRVPER
ncbi:MAG: HAMP domain-containing histidine kinase [Nitriliruptoraceae bacterium]|nr:HAMP domain-containing histidine kinase [Nitriliruptoraceae bacterium]